jgi:hypothetical protein
VVEALDCVRVAYDRIRLQKLSNKRVVGAALHVDKPGEALVVMTGVTQIREIGRRRRSKVVEASRFGCASDAGQGNDAANVVLMKEANVHTRLTIAPAYFRHRGLTIGYHVVVNEVVAARRINAIVEVVEKQCRLSGPHTRNLLLVGVVTKRHGLLHYASPFADRLPKLEYSTFNSGNGPAERCSK